VVFAKKRIENDKNNNNSNNNNNNIENNKPKGKKGANKIPR